jgi:large subunit ribosomal protein L9
MEVLLKRSIDTLGRLGDVVTVKPGYARNYLLPFGFAVPVTKANVAMIEKERARALVEEKARISHIKEMADRIAQTSVTLEGRANEEGHLFGSVNAAQIAAALKQKGFHIEDKQVRLDAPLKEIGVYDVTIHLHTDVTATAKVWVVQTKPS